MKIICAGFWKTGTKSLAQALETLGYKVYDYDYQLFELSDLWKKFIEGTVTDDDIRDSLKDVDVIIDGPVIAFWEEISRAIPEAKVILTIRDEDSWWRSFKGMMLKPPAFFKYFFAFTLLGPFYGAMMRRALYVGSFCLGVEGPFRFPFINFTDNPRLYKFKYRQHNSHVQMSVPEEKLLVLEPGSGWESLCKFLGKDVPDVPYPHKNKDGAHFHSEGGPKHPGWKRLQIEALMVMAVFVCLVAIALYYVFSYFI